LNTKDVTKQLLFVMILQWLTRITTIL